MICQHIIFPFIYFINRLRPVDKNLVLLADAHHKSCPPYMEEMRAGLYKRNIRFREYFFDLKELSFWQGFRKMISFMAIYPTCGTVIICDYFLPVASCNKKKKTRVIQLWHGCGAFKKFGYSTVSDIPAGYKGNVFNNNDIITVSGENCIKPFSIAMQAGGRVFPVGVSHTDRLFNQEYIAGCRDKLRYVYPDSAGKKIVLWAPTFRGNPSKPYVVGEKDVEGFALNMNFGLDVYVIKCLHPNLGPGEMTADELIACADVLITDYSSIFFEYLIMDKPVIFFAPDYEEYNKERGFYLEYEDLPGDIITGHENCSRRIRDAVITALTIDPVKNRRAVYRREYMSACDGYATGRIIERYILCNK